MTLLNTADAVYLGAVAADRVYLGDVLVWEPASAYRDRIKSLVPISYWRLGEPVASPAAVDEMGLTNPIYTGSPTLGVVGLLGRDKDTAMRVAGGPTQGVMVGQSAAYQIGEGTLEAWVKTDDAGAALRSILVKQNAYGLFTMDNKLAAYEWGTSVIVNSGIDIADGKRHHVAYTFGPYGVPGASQLYLDGKPVGPTATHSHISLGANLTIGYNDYPSQEFIGVIDEVAIYGRKLTAAEIWGNYEVGITFDESTQEFLDATGLPSYFGPALDVLVRGLKEHGLWAKMAAIYPFIGGTAELHKWNLKDPRDLDAAYRLTYVASSTGTEHSVEEGYLPNVVGGQATGYGYANTHFVPLGALDQNSTHLAAHYLADVPPKPRCDMGCFNWTGTSQSRFHIIARYQPSEFYFGQSEEGFSNATVPATDGLFVSTRTAANQQAGYRNGVAVGSNANPPAAGLPPVPVLIGAINSGVPFNEYSDLPVGFASIGAGLTAQDVAHLHTVMVEYQVAARNAKWTPDLIPGLLTWIDPAQDMYVEGEKIASYVEHSEAHRTFLAGDARPEYQPIFRASPPRLQFPDPTNFGMYATGVNLGPAGFTFVLVDTAFDTINFPMKIVSGTDADGWEFRNDGSAIQIVERYSTAGIYYSGQADPPGTKVLHVLRVKSGVLTEVWVNSVLYQNGATAIAHNAPLDLWIARRQGGYYWRGTMSEVLVYAGPISDADLTLLKQYLATKHGLSI